MKCVVIVEKGVSLIELLFERSPSSSRTLTKSLFTIRVGKCRHSDIQ